MVVEILVEGQLDADVAMELLRFAELEAGTVYGRQGWTYVRRKLPNFSRATGPGYALLALVDFMDTREECPPAVVRSWLPQATDYTVLRVVVREIESWILADRRGFSSFAKIPIAKVPANPEELQDPKTKLLSLVHRHSQRTLRERLVRRSKTGLREGPEYTACLGEFVHSGWSVERAASVSDSLSRTLVALNRLSAEETP